MSFVKSKGFKYLKNLVIGVGAALVMLGALYKINSWPMPSIGGASINLLSVGLITEAILFLFLGVIGPEKDYYWEKLYPGLDKYESKIAPLGAGEVGDTGRPINGEIVENQLGGMLTELQTMSKSLGSLKALQEIDFTETGEQVKTLGNFYGKLNEAMTNLAGTIDDTQKYKEQMTALNDNLSSLNGVYGNVLTAMTGRNNA